ncbi:MAG TPA: LacI family DNA-binding transcriptional regulator [Ilumatobacteraceae bacterium]|nr:LacI family DNA-binding transcriptional regulator [Ilumatobacteraceae bacterium]
MSATPTMADVGRHAGVGIGTVSRVLNGSVHVTDATRRKVLESAEAIGYQRTRKSAADRGKGGSLVAVLVPFFDEQSAFQRLRGIVSRLAPHGCSVVLHNVESPAQARAKLLELPRSATLGGLIVVTLPLVGDEGDRLISGRFPTVLIDAVYPGLPSVGIDDRAGGALATKHLISLGHRRIAFVSEPPHNAFGFVAGARREEGFRAVMAEAGLKVPANLVRYGAYLHSAARQMATELLSLPERPTAIVAASDVQAIGCMEAASRLGISVPDELSVVGYDDIDLATLMGLSTVRQPLVYSGERGADLLLEALSMPNRIPHTERLELELVVRSTTAAVQRKNRR